VAPQRLAARLHNHPALRDGLPSYDEGQRRQYVQMAGHNPEELDGIRLKFLSSECGNVYCGKQ
jgi:hypothetical protein